VSKRRSVKALAGLRVRCLRVKQILSPVVGSDDGWNSTMDEGTWRQYM
jgi:hypothetical protein